MSGITFTFEQGGSDSAEINRPGEDVGYDATSPTHYKSKPDSKGGVPAGHGMPETHSDDANPATSRVTPSGMGETLRDNLTYQASVRRVVAKYLKAMTIPNLLSGTSQKILSSGDGVQLKQKGFNPDKGLWKFQATGSKGETYNLTVKGVRKGSVKDVSKAEIKVSCDCPAFQYQGPSYWAEQKGYQYKGETGIAPPTVRDPQGKNLLCKHLVAALRLAQNYKFSSESPQWLWEGKMVRERL